MPALDKEKGVVGKVTAGWEAQSEGHAVVALLRHSHACAHREATSLFGQKDTTGRSSGAWLISVDCTPLHTYDLCLLVVNSA